MAEGSIIRFEDLVKKLLITSEHWSIFKTVPEHLQITDADIVITGKGDIRKINYERVECTWEVDTNKYILDFIL